MAVVGKNRHYRWKEIHARHWIETGKRFGFGEMKEILDEAIARTPGVIEQVRTVMPAGFPAQLTDAILRGIKFCAQQLARELAGR